MQVENSDAPKSLAARANKGSLTERLALGAIAIASIVALALIGVMNIFTIRVQKQLLGILALLFILIYSSAFVVALWKTGQRARPPFWYFKNFGFWLTAFAYIAIVCILTTMVLFEMILPLPAFLPTPFIDSLSWVGLGTLLFTILGFTVWLGQVALKSRREFRRWLDTGEW